MYFRLPADCSRTCTAQHLAQDRHSELLAGAVRQVHGRPQLLVGVLRVDVHARVHLHRLREPRRRRLQHRRDRVRRSCTCSHRWRVNCIAAETAPSRICSSRWHAATRCSLEEAVCSPRAVVFAGTLDCISLKRRDRFLFVLKGGAPTMISPSSSADGASAGGASSVAPAHRIDRAAERPATGREWKAPARRRQRLARWRTSLSWQHCAGEHTGAMTPCIAAHPPAISCCQRDPTSHSKVDVKG